MLQKALEFIKENESFSETAYRDGPGFSIGYGFYLGEAPENQLKRMTRQEADEKIIAILNGWVTRCFNNIHPEVRQKLTESQKVALYDFIYNLGCPQFSGSTLFRLLQDGKITEAGQQFQRWIYSTNSQGVKFKVKALETRNKKRQELWMSESFQDYKKKDYSKLLERLGLLESRLQSLMDSYSLHLRKTNK